MHIAKFIEEQQRLNPEPKHWWQRRSALYERALMGIMALSGLVLAIYMPVQFLTAPYDVIGNSSYGFALGLTVFLTSAGIGWLVAGSLAFKSLNRPMLISHGEAIVVLVVAATITTGFSMVLNREMRKGLQVTAAIRDTAYAIKLAELEQASILLDKTEMIGECGTTGMLKTLPSGMLAACKDRKWHSLQTGVGTVEQMGYGSLEIHGRLPDCKPGVVLVSGCHSASR